LFKFAFVNEPSFDGGKVVAKAEVGTTLGST